MQEKLLIEKKKTCLDFNYVKPCFELFPFSYNFMTKGFSNLNLDIKSIRKIDRPAKMGTDRKTKSETLTDKVRDRQTEIMNRELREYISLRTKLAISFNRGKINAIALE